MTKYRIYLLWITSMLLPFFIPGARDILVDWNQQYRVQETLQETVEKYQKETDPARLALLRYGRDLRMSSAKLVLDGEAVTTANGEPAESDIPAPGDYSLRATGCTLDAGMVEAVLDEYGSPAAGKGIGEVSVTNCKRTKIDNAYWLAMFIYESGAGSNPRWAGRKPDGTYTANTGNIICAGFRTCYGRFRDYEGNWQWGVEQHFDLLRCYRDGGGAACDGLWNGKSHETIREAISTWAPPAENNTNAYADYVEKQVDEWRTLRRGQFVTDGPEGEPQVAEPLVNSPPEGVVETSISFDDGPFGQNVRSIINSSPDLQNVSIPPGGSFSFNERWKINGDGQLTTYVVYGGGACNVAGVYSNVARKLGLAPRFTHHGTKLNELPWEDAVSIWSSGVRGGQDLQIENTTNKTLRFTAELGDGKLTVRGWLE